MEVVPKDTSEPKHLHDFSPSYFTGDEDLSMERMRSDFSSPDWPFLSPLPLLYKYSIPGHLPENDE